METQSLENIRSTILEQLKIKFGKDYDQFIDMLCNGNYIIGGQFVLHCILGISNSEDDELNIYIDVTQDSSWNNKHELLKFHAKHYFIPIDIHHATHNTTIDEEIDLIEHLSVYKNLAMFSKVNNENQITLNMKYLDDIINKTTDFVARPREPPIKTIITLFAEMQFKVNVVVGEHIRYVPTIIKRNNKIIMGNQTFTIQKIESDKYEVDNNISITKLIGHHCFCNTYGNGKYDGSICTKNHYKNHENIRDSIECECTMGKECCELRSYDINIKHEHVLVTIPNNTNYANCAASEHKFHLIQFDYDGTNVFNRFKEKFHDATVDVEKLIDFIASALQSYDNEYERLESPCFI